MAATTASELRELTDDELVLRLRESKEELLTSASRWPPVSWTTIAGYVRSAGTSPASTP
jgi:hypothetical protein